MTVDTDDGMAKAGSLMQMEDGLIFCAHLFSEIVEERLCGRAEIIFGEADDLRTFKEGDSKADTEEYGPMMGERESMTDGMETIVGEAPGSRETPTPEGGPGVINKLVGKL